ncbi:unnamed protein product [Clonostachys solani]|uniref:YAG7-like dimerisation domain-containing protein n=1 Tax=Clonostachys solani TaxID=160281 RepID=A0A9N9W2Y0_9HYPO|nr:unnamed protein product [Clonostachys solani]
MAASTAQSGSKPKKTATKAIERTESPAPSAVSGQAEKGDESPYIRELQKNIRSVNKKISHDTDHEQTNASKVDVLLKEHSDKSLEELVDAKIINTDQKAQVLKKPALQTQLTQLEEQLSQILKIDEQYRTKAAADKTVADQSLEKAKADAVAEAKESFDKTLRGNLLLLSQFLRLAAYRREEATDPESDESQAIEGVLLAIYTGDESAVNSMLKLVDGSSDQIWSVPGEQLQTTYAKVKSLAQDYKTPNYAEGADAPETNTEVTTDPTIANAGATELDATVPVAGEQEQAVQTATNGIANINVSDEAANAVAESHWDTPAQAAISQEWVDVKVPRDPAETDNGLTATPAAAGNNQSWADDHPEPAAETAPANPVEPNDGFHQVQRNRGRNEREGGNHRGRGRGEWRGRGRGDGRGRGRGNRNAGGAPRGGARRQEEL